MKINNIYEDYSGDERIYSVVLDENELRLYAQFDSGLTKYDETDKFKRMKDSDILAEKKRSNAGSYLNAAKTAGIGSAVGAGLGAMFHKKLGMGAKGGALLGAGIGGAVSGMGSLISGHKKREDNRFVNRRLSEMKRNAKRRESKDWKDQSVNREGYTY